MMNYPVISDSGAEHENYGQSLICSLNRLLADSAADWNCSKGTVVAVSTIPVWVALIGIVTALMGKQAYKWFTAEDGFAEDLQVLFYALAFLLSLMIIRILWRNSRQAIALLYAGVSLGLLFLIGEELSWGQRIFEWDTSQSWAGINKQGETNLHNIYGVEDAFRWIQLMVGAYGTLLPILVLQSATLSRFLDILSMLVPHVTLVPYFAFMSLWRCYRNFFDVPRKYYFVISEYNEVIELILAMGFFLFMVYQLQRMKARRT